MTTQVGKPLTITLAFGASNAGLTTVGYQLYNSDGTPNGARQTDVVEVGHGSYQTTKTWDAVWTGSLIGDTGGGSPRYTDAAAIAVVAADSSTADFDAFTEALNALEADVSQLPLIRAPA